MAFMGHKESCGESKREPRYMAAPALIARATPSARLFEPNPVSYNPSSKARAKSSGLGACDAREALRTRASPAAFGASCERCCAVAIPTCRILCTSPYAAPVGGIVCIGVPSVRHGEQGFHAVPMLGKI